MTVVAGLAADGLALAWFARVVFALVVEPISRSKPVVAVAVQPVPTAGEIAGVVPSGR